MIVSVHCITPMWALSLVFHSHIIFFSFLAELALGLQNNNVQTQTHPAVSRPLLINVCVFRVIVLCINVQEIQEFNKHDLQVK
jgi:uncharacterized membrane protein